MTYAAETRAETAATKQLLRTTEITTVRRIVGKLLGALSDPNGTFKMWYDGAKQE